MAPYPGPQQPAPYPPPQAYAPAPQAVPIALELRCVAGPDNGKGFVIGPMETVLGKACGVGQFDPVIAPQHLALSVVNDRLRFRALTPNPVFINSQPYAQGELMPGQEFLMGASLWRVSQPGHNVGGNFLQSLQDGLSRLAGTEKLQGFSLKDMFSEVFKKHTPDEIEDYLGAGTPRTTPSILQVETGWPKPWLFVRILAIVALSYVALTFCLDHFQNVKALPGVIITGALAVPLAVLVLFYELNAPRNVSFPKLLGLVAIGGAMSLVVALFGYAILPQGSDEWLLHPAGLIEESAKLAVVVALIRGTKYKYILNGMLFGAAVGTGFAVFETAGYAFEALQNGAVAAMSQNLHMRAWLSPFGHMPWAALAAGALWRVKGDSPLRPNMFGDPRFLKLFAIPVVLHTLWDSNKIFGIGPQTAESVVMVKFLVLGLIGWYVVFMLVQQGLRQVKDEQVRAAQQGLRSIAAA